MNSFKQISNFFSKVVLSLIFLVTFSNFHSLAQGTGYLELVGSVLQLNKGLEGSDITVMKGNEKTGQYTTNAGGKFIVNLDLNASYTLIFSKNGSISKTVEFDTKVPDENKDQIFSLKFKMDLFKTVEGVEAPSDVTKPVAKYAFSEVIDDFDYDPNYSNARKSELEKVKQEMQAQLAKQKQEEELAKARMRADSLATVNEARAAQAKALADELKLKKEAEALAKEQARQQAIFAATEKARQDSILQRQVAEEQARLKALAKMKEDSLAQVRAEEQARLLAEAKQKKEAE
ncbi:MAG TPA: cell envelope integrity protein TolA, partial [Bacteroidia bacterium]|nr:cell envelope integrity protein TolA [Bacteroidia bacterium]